MIMKYVVEKLEVDIYPLLQSKKITEKQIKSMLAKSLEKAGYALQRDINLGHLLTNAHFDEFYPEVLNYYLFFWIEVKKDEQAKYVALYHPFVPWLYVVLKNDVELVDEFSFGSFEFPLGYEKTIGGGDLATAMYLNAYRLRCQVRLGWWRRTISLEPKALVVDTIHITKDNMRHEMPLNKLFLRLVRSNVASEREYNLGEHFYELVSKLKF